jgi:hypothetical protein
VCQGDYSTEHGKARAACPSSGVDCDTVTKLRMTHSVADMSCWLGLKKTYILIQLGIRKKLFRLITMRLKEAMVSCIQANVFFSDEFCIKNGLKGGHSLPPLRFNFTLE